MQHIMSSVSSYACASPERGRERESRTRPLDNLLSCFVNQSVLGWKHGLLLMWCAFPCKRPFDLCSWLEQCCHSFDLFLPSMWRLQCGHHTGNFFPNVPLGRMRRPWCLRGLQCKDTGRIYNHFRLLRPNLWPTRLIRVEIQKPFKKTNTSENNTHPDLASSLLIMRTSSQASTSVGCSTNAFSAIPFSINTMLAPAGSSASSSTSSTLVGDPFPTFFGAAPSESGGNSPFRFKLFTSNFWATFWISLATRSWRRTTWQENSCWEMKAGLPSNTARQLSHFSGQRPSTWEEHGRTTWTFPWTWEELPWSFPHLC